MNLILYSFMAINLLFIIAFTLGRWFIFKQKNKPNLIAGYSVFLGMLFLAYFISILLVVGISLLHQKYFSLFLLIFIMMPFILGKKVTYKKLRFYSNLQLALFFVSLLISYFLIF